MIYSSGRLARHGLLDHAHQVRFSDNNELFTVEGDLGPRPFTEQHAVADRDVQRVKLAVSERAPGPTATTVPSIGFSCAVSGMKIPPAVFCSGSTRRTTTRSCNGRNVIKSPWSGVSVRLPAASSRFFRKTVECTKSFQCYFLDGIYFRKCNGLVFSQII